MATKKKDPAAAALGKKGGLARARNLSAEELSEQGKKAITARWAKQRAGKKRSQKPQAGR